MTKIHQITEAAPPLSYIETTDGPVFYLLWLHAEIERNHDKDFRKCWVQEIGNPDMVALFSDDPSLVEIADEDAD